MCDSIRQTKKIMLTCSSPGHLLQPDHALGLPPHQQGDVQAEGGDEADVEKYNDKKVPPGKYERTPEKILQPHLRPLPANPAAPLSCSAITALAVAGASRELYTCTGFLPLIKVACPPPSRWFNIPLLRVSCWFSEPNTV